MRPSARIGGAVLVVVSQIVGWVVIIGMLTAGAGAVSGLFGSSGSLDDSLLVGGWVAILLGGPVAIAAAAVAMRRFLRADPWPGYAVTGRWVVTIVWFALALFTAGASGTVVAGLPWYGSIGAGIWLAAPFALRLAPEGAR